MSRAAGPELDDLLEEYGRASDEFAALGGYDVEQRIAEVLQGLDLGDIASDTPLSILSGGQRTRAGLASIIVSAPDVLLLDEPTNHLDIQALEWLEEYLSSYEGAALIVSHDRAFLDGAVTGILELDGSASRSSPHIRATTLTTGLPKSVSLRSRPPPGRTRRPRGEGSRET